MTLQYYEQDATPLDPDEIEGLKLNHITTRGELNRWEQENIQEAFEQQPFSWGSGNLVDTGTLRGLYISALKAADRNDYSLLKEFVRS